MTYTERMNELGGEFLGKLYDLSGGDWHKNFSFSAIGDDLGWDGQQTSSAVDYLVEEGLMQYHAMGQVMLTRAGVDAWEEALRQTGEAAKPDTIGFRAPGG